MTSLVEILFVAALAIVAPRDGARVAVQSEVQRAYLARPCEERLKLMGDAAVRGKLAADGDAAAPVKLEWTGSSDRVATVSFTAEGEVERVLALTNGETHVWAVNLELGKKYLWSVESGGEVRGASFTADATPPRLLRAEGVFNFRDLGGWTGLGGRRVRQNMVFRSAGLRSSAQKAGGSMIMAKYVPGERRVTDRGIATLREEFGIRTDVELRNESEAAFMTSSVLGPDVGWVRVPFAAYDFVGDIFRGREPFARVFRTFTDRKNYPILFHCSGGRDRTGTLAFLLNGLLGVSEDDLCRDWGATAFGDGALSFSAGRIARLRDYIGSLPGDTFTERVERYVRSCGVTEEEIAAFREIMLEDAR